MSVFTIGNGNLFSANNKIFKSPWSPNKLDGMVFWGDANSRNIQIENNLISEWNDTSGSQNNAVQTTTSFKPTYVENFINGFPALYFQNNKCVNIPLTLDYFTIFTVIKSNNNKTVYEFGDNSSIDSGFVLNGDKKCITVTNSGLSNIASQKEYENSWLVDSNWKIIAHQYNGTHSTHRLFINSELKYLSTSLDLNGDPGALNKSFNLNLGAKSDGSIGSNAYISEYIVFDNYLSTSEIENISTYLNQKYQIY